MAENKYVIFKLNEEHYGIDIMKVREVTDAKQSTKVPNTPSFVEGIINLRGDITPIINLKRKFMLPVNVVNDARVIVLSVNEKLVGFQVDDASQVLTIEDSDIDAPPDIITGEQRKYIQGIGKVDDRIVIILDLEKVLTDREKEELANMES